MEKTYQKKKQGKTKALLITTALAVALGFGIAPPSYATETSEKYELQDLFPIEEYGKGDSIVIPVKYNDDKTSNFSFFSAANLKAMASQYSSKNNVVKVKDQQQTGSCWAFSATTVLEHYRYKQSTSNTEVFSPKHIEYATANKYSDGTATNSELYSDCVFNRAVNSGGNAYASFAYFTSGEGPVLESEMPFSSPNEKINASSLNVPKTDIEVEKYIILPNIQKDYSTGSLVYKDSAGETISSSEVNSIREQIKSAIYNYGSVTAMTYLDTTYFNEDMSAYFCNDSSVGVDHAITIIGWDDTYSASNFNPNNRPSQDGAYIVQNSHGTQNYDEGYMYVSYEDVNIELNCYAIASLKEKSYDYIYQYDNLGVNRGVGAGTSSTGYATTLYGANVFTKQSTGKETLKQVGVSTLVEEDVEIYVVPNYQSVSDLNVSTATKVKSTVHLEPGYQAITLDTPVTLENDKFAVVVKFTNSEQAILPFECNLLSNGSMLYPQWQTATASAGQSYFSTLESGTSFSDLNDTFKDTNIAIKAFTEAEDNGVTFSVKGNSNYARTASTAVTVDTGAASMKTLKYQWTQSTTKPETSTFTQTFNNGETITKSDGSGNWYLWIYAVDSNDKEIIVSSDKFCLDNTVPEKPTVTSTNGGVSGKFTMENVILKIEGKAPLSGIQKYQYTIDGGKNWGDLTAANNIAQIQISGEGRTNIQVRTISNVQIEGTTSDVFEVCIDRTAPVINLEDGATYETLKVTFTDVSNLTIQLHRNQVPIAFEEGDVLTDKLPYRFLVTDEVGLSTLLVFNYDENNKVTFDKTGPTVTFGTNGSTRFARSQSTVVTVTDDMDSDVTTYRYQWVQGESTPTTESFKTSFSTGSNITKNDGTGKDWYLWVYAKDTQGNETKVRSNAFYLDNAAPTKPTIEINVEDGGETLGPVRFKISGGSALCGIQKYQYSYDGINWKNVSPGITTVISELGRYTLRVRSVNTLSVVGEYEEISFSIVDQLTEPEPENPNTNTNTNPGTNTNTNPGTNTNTDPGTNTNTNPGTNTNTDPGTNTNTNPGTNTNTDPGMNTNTNPGTNTNTNPGTNTNTDPGTNTNTNPGTNTNTNPGTNTNTNPGTNTNTDPGTNTNTNPGTNTNTNQGTNTGNNGGITIGGGNGTTTSGGGTTIGGSTNTSNVPTTTSGNLDTTQKTGTIPQTGDSILTIVIRASIMLVAIAAIIIYEKIIRIERARK